MKFSGGKLFLAAGEHDKICKEAREIPEGFFCFALEEIPARYVTDRAETLATRWNMRNCNLCVPRVEAKEGNIKSGSWIIPDQNQGNMGGIENEIVAFCGVGMSPELLETQRAKYSKF